MIKTPLGIKRVCGEGLWYLGGPYSSVDPFVRVRRWHLHCEAAAMLLRVGVTVVSPIAMFHPISRYGLPTGWQFWGEHDKALLRVCEGIIVATIPGWKESEGLMREIEFVEGIGKRVVMFKPWKEEERDDG